MKRKLVALLLVVVFLFSCTYVSAEDIDLASMTDQELKALRTAINEELNKREEERKAAAPVDLYDIYRKYEDLARDYQFQELIDIIDSGESYLSDAAASDIRQYCVEGLQAIENIYFRRDEFTGRVFMFDESVPNVLGEDGFKVVPAIDYEGFCLLVAFPEGSQIFNPDEAYIKIGEDSSRYGCSMPSFETFEREVWEYITITNVSLGEAGRVDMIALRSNDSPRNVDVVPSEQEQAAIASVWAPAWAVERIEDRLSNWRYGDDQGI